MRCWPGYTAIGRWCGTMSMRRQKDGGLMICIAPSKIDWCTSSLSNLIRKSLLAWPTRVMVQQKNSFCCPWVSSTRVNWLFAELSVVDSRMFVVPFRYSVLHLVLPELFAFTTWSMATSGCLSSSGYSSMSVVESPDSTSAASCFLQYIEWHQSRILISGGTSERVF